MSSDTESTVSCWRSLGAQRKRRASRHSAGHDNSSRPSSYCATPEMEPGSGLSASLLPLALPLAQLLCCPGCHRFLRHPVSLPCGHCLCQPCLAGLRKKASLTDAVNSTPTRTDATAVSTINPTPTLTDATSIDTIDATPTPTDATSIDTIDATPTPTDTTLVDAINAAPTSEGPSARCPRCQASFLLVPGGGAWSFPANVLLVQTAERLLGAHPELCRLLRWRGARRRGLRFGFRSVVSTPCPPLPAVESPRPAPCQLCPVLRRPARSYCATCRLHYCTKCLHKLHGNPAYRAHVLAEPAREEERELCPAHPERSLTHACQSDGALGCHGCLAQPGCAHHGHQVATLSEARASTENMLSQALEHANMVLQQCDCEREQMEALLDHVTSHGAELQGTIRQGFQSLRDALDDQEVALLARLDGLSSSTAAVARDFLQCSGPARGSLAGLCELGKQALQEPRASVFLQGAAGMARWLEALSAEVPRPDAHLLPTTRGRHPFTRVLELHFDRLLCDLQGHMKKHLCWRDANTVVMPTAIAREMVGEEQEEEEEQVRGPEEEEEEGEEEDVLSRQGAPSLGRGVEEEPLALGMPAGDGAPDAKGLLLPRPPIIYQHNVYGRTVEVFWMVPMGEDVHSFDVHIQDASVGVVNGQGVVMGGVKGSSLQTSGLRCDTQYLFRARSVNAYGHGPWSSAYRVGTGRLHEGEEQNSDPAQEA